MKLEGAYTISAPRESVWYCLREPNMLVQAIPGCQFWQVGADGTHRSTLDFQVGPVQGLMNNKLQLETITHLESYRFIFESEGSPGQVTCTGQITLTENGRFATTVTYTADVAMTGRLSGLADRLLITSLKSFFRQTLTSLDQQLNGGVANTPSSAPDQGEHKPPPWLAPVLLIAGLLILKRLFSRNKS